MASESEPEPEPEPAPPGEAPFPFFKASVFQCTGCGRTAGTRSTILAHQLGKCGPRDIVERKAWLGATNLRTGDDVRDAARVRRVWWAEYGVSSARGHAFACGSCGAAAPRKRFVLDHLRDKCGLHVDIVETSRDPAAPGSRTWLAAHGHRVSSDGREPSQPFTQTGSPRTRP